MNPEDFILNSRQVLQFAEDLLVMMRSACQEVAEGSRTVTIADIQRLISGYDVAIEAAKAGRAKYEQWAAAYLAASPTRVM